jgi:hypothetical protein
MVKEWKKKLAQEGETAHFLASYTKECPKCNTISTSSPSFLSLFLFLSHFILFYFISFLMDLNKFSFFGSLYFFVNE